MDTSMARTHTPRKLGLMHAPPHPTLFDSPIAGLPDGPRVRPGAGKG